VSEQISIETIVSNRDGKPYVVLKWGQESGQLTPEQARQHALSILEAAEAAEGDAFITEWVTDRIGADGERAVMLLREFRAYRSALAEHGG
jgi:hypothetical protein